MLTTETASDELEKARQRSQTRFRNIFEAIYEKYGQIDEADDILDLSTGELIVDNGRLRTSKAVVWGDLLEYTNPSDTEDDGDKPESPRRISTHQSRPALGNLNNQTHSLDPSTLTGLPDDGIATGESFMSDSEELSEADRRHAVDMSVIDTGSDVSSENHFTMSIEQYLENLRKQLTESQNGSSGAAGYLSYESSIGESDNEEPVDSVYNSFAEGTGFSAWNGIPENDPAYDLKRPKHAVWVEIDTIMGQERTERQSDRGLSIEEIDPISRHRSWNNDITGMQSMEFTEEPERNIEILKSWAYRQQQQQISHNINNQNHKDQSLKQLQRQPETRHSVSSFIDDTNTSHYAQWNTRVSSQLTQQEHSNTAYWQHTDPPSSNSIAYFAPEDPGELSGEEPIDSMAPAEYYQAYNCRPSSSISEAYRTLNISYHSHRNKANSFPPHQQQRTQTDAKTTGNSQRALMHMQDNGIGLELHNNAMEFVLANNGEWHSADSYAELDSRILPPSRPNALNQVPFVHRPKPVAPSAFFDSSRGESLLLQDTSDRESVKSGEWPLEE